MKTHQRKGYVAPYRSAPAAPELIAQFALAPLVHCPTGGDADPAGHHREERRRQGNCHQSGHGLTAKRSATATKTDTPQAITVVTRDHREAQGVQTLRDTAAYSAGVATSFYDCRSNAFKFCSTDPVQYLEGLQRVCGVYYTTRPDRAPEHPHHGKQFGQPDPTHQLHHQCNDRSSGTPGVQRRPDERGPRPCDAAQRRTDDGPSQGLTALTAPPAATPSLVK